MRARRLLGQHLFMGLEGPKLLTHEARFLVDNNIGGVILFSRNFESFSQLKSLTQDLNAAVKDQSSQLPLFISVDMEGGRVARFRKDFTVWPAAARLGEINSTQLTTCFGYAMGSELRAAGINLDFAPVLDVFSNPKNTVIGDRAFGSEPLSAATHAIAFSRGLIKSGVIPCGKHFPGHGNTLVDSHEGLPREDKTLPELERLELIPFKTAIKSGLDLIMTSHILFPSIDPHWPVTLSEIFLRKLLRDELRYKGLVISDDLGMGALTKNYDPQVVPVRALQAGVDLLLYCNDPQAPGLGLAALRKALDEGRLSLEKIEASHDRIAAFKRQNLRSAFAREELVGLPAHRELSEAIIQGQIPSNLETQFGLLNWA